MSHFRIRANSLRPESPLTFDLYLLLHGKHVLYRRADTSVEKAKIDMVEAKETSLFYVMDSERQAFKNYVHDIMNNPEVEVKAKATLLKESSMALIEEIFENPDAKKALDETKSVISNFLEFMAQEATGMSHLIGLSSHDFYTYNHSLDVSIYALGLGQISGYSDPKDLLELGRGALLHDIGKRHVATEIICKNGPLNDTEWAQMKQHPAFGLKILNEVTDASDEVKACVFEHHENHLGNGYPQQLQADEIHPMARIVALTDTYDALTTKRSYNEPMRPREALNLMKEKLSGRFDPDLLNAMHSVLFQIEKEA